MKVCVSAARLAAALAIPLPPSPGPARAIHNVIIFVADGLRHSSVTPDLAPTFASVRQSGVDFTNSHSIYPTVTTANASAIATGHYLGDTGDYANTLWFGYPVMAKGGTQLTFFEDDGVLRDVKAHFGADYMGETSLLAAARAAGMTTAVIGKLGPAAIQDITAIDGIVIDGGAGPIGLDGRPTGFVKISDDLAKRIAPRACPTRRRFPLLRHPNRAAGLHDRRHGQGAAAYDEERGKPFALLYWCRDPDATSMPRRRSVGAITPGINGPTAHAGIADADAQLKRLLGTLKALGLDRDHRCLRHRRSRLLDHLAQPAHRRRRHPAGLAAARLPSPSIARRLAEAMGPRRRQRRNLEENGTHPARGSAMIGPSAAARSHTSPPMAAATVYTPGGIDTAKTIYAQLLNAPYTGALSSTTRSSRPIPPPSPAPCR